ncbi:MAG: tRNA pseudouridine(55) synthase TruB [Dehalococcoidia bacterium]|nr:tRNA pseudouridine(55) synthase TruB [Dehalococcoidia bacterium]
MKFLESGILLIDKPYQWTSNDVLRKIKSKYKFNKIGHAGTLDPLATGILPILVNNSTKYFDYFQNFKKSYLTEIKFGFSTKTYDLEGDIDGKTEILPEKIESIEGALKNFIGSIDQIPPKYSAIKKGGKRLYQYARNDEEIEIKSRKVDVSDIKIISWEKPVLKLIIKCSSGFYVRSFANDLARKLKTLGVLISLSRVNYGPFDIKDSLRIENIFDLENRMLSIDSILVSNPKLSFDFETEKSYLNGGVFTSENLNLNLLNDEDIKIYNNNDVFIGLLTFDKVKKFWKPKNIIK